MAIINNINQSRFSWEVRASDPASPQTAQVWYNSTDDVYRGCKADTWVSQSSASTAAYAPSGTSLGSDTLKFGGSIPSVTAVTEYFDTSADSWGGKTAMNTGSNFGAAASLDSDNSLAFGGNNGGDLNNTQLYNLTGNNWTNKGNLNNARNRLSGCALTSTTALSVGGSAPSTTTETYDLTGDSWTNKTGPGTNVARGTGSSIDSGDGMTSGGSGGPTAVVQLYDTSGDSWSTQSSMSQAREYLASGGMSSNRVLTFGGGNAAGTYYGTTESYSLSADTWETSASMNTSRDRLAGAAISSTEAVSMCGYNGSPLATTELFTGPVIVDFTVT